MNSRFTALNGNMAKKAKIRLKPGASIGQLAAEDDHKFLTDCFISHPTVDTLKDVTSHFSLLLGRTGSGKSAILWHLENSLPNVSRVHPKDIAFEYVGNSTIIRTLNELGVDLHVLYEYLWTHALTLHFIRECLGVRSNEGLGKVFDFIKTLVWRDDKRAIALKYLEKHADNFWINVEQVSAEFTNVVADKLAVEAGLSPQMFKAKIERGNEWKDEEKRLFKYRAREIVSSLQMRELKVALEALSATINKDCSYYVLIDDLDHEWAGDANTQYALIRALLECLKTFRRIPNLKIIVAMREDLFEATLRTTTDKHFQAEKLEGIIKRLRWNDAMLIALIEKRITELFRYQYTKQTIKLADVLPENIAQTTLSRYLIDHTLRRPRDVIAFVNRILIENEGEQLPLSARAITKVEPGYSNDRLRALEDEWRSCHPLIRSYLKVAQGLPGNCTVAIINEDRLLELAIDASDLNRRPVDDVERIAKTVYERDKEVRFRRLARALVTTLFKVGAVGVKLQPQQPHAFCYEQRSTVEDGEIGDETKIVIHPMLMTSLGVHSRRTYAA
jgi:hypothetical protein